MAAVLLAAVSLLGAAQSAQAQQISYTIQVVALSDLDSATDIQTDLLRQGFPAYVVRSTSTQGAVYRVRVGAFANRAAALLYAQAMPEVAGGQPVPALAEGIPAGINPLAPRLVHSQDLTGLDSRLLLVGGDLALRTQQRSPLSQAEYTVMAAGGVEVVRAWQFTKAADGTRVVVRDMLLWPDTWQDEPSEVLEGYQSSLIALVAERLELDPATVRAARYGLTAGAPRLIVVERIVPGATDGPELLGLGIPVSGMTPAGPLQYLGIQPEELPGLPDGVRLDLATPAVLGELDLELGPELEQLQSAAGDDQPEADDGPADTSAEAEAGSDAGDDTGADAGSDASAETGAETDTQPAEPAAAVAPEARPADSETTGAGPLLSGDGWFAVADGPFVRLTVPAASEGLEPTSWRAALGTPLWSGAGYLVAYEQHVILIYDFLPRD